MYAAVDPRGQLFQICHSLGRRPGYTRDSHSWAADLIWEGACPCSHTLVTGPKTSRCQVQLRIKHVSCLVSLLDRLFTVCRIILMFPSFSVSMVLKANAPRPRVSPFSAQACSGMLGLRRAAGGGIAECSGAGGLGLLVWQLPLCVLGQSLNPLVRATLGQSHIPHAEGHTRGKLAAFGEVGSPPSSSPYWKAATAASGEGVPSSL